MKKIFAVVGIIALLGMLSVPLFAQGGPGGQGTGSMMGPRNPADCPRYQGWKSNLTSEQAEKLKALHQKFYDETAPIRTGLCAKKGELRILMNTSTPAKDKALALQKEISALKAKMAEAKLNYLFEARKIDPNATFGMGLGKGGDGRGRGQGHGKGNGPRCNMDCRAMGGGNSPRCLQN